MSFTDQKPRTATLNDIRARWGGAAPGERFRCYLCGYRFGVGDHWRWVYGGGTTIVLEDGRSVGLPNGLVCSFCDGPGLIDRWAEHVRTSYRLYWWLYD